MKTNNQTLDPQVQTSPQYLKQKQSYIKSQFINFLQNFKQTTTSSSSSAKTIGQKKYIKRMQQLCKNSKRVLLINTKDLFSYDSDLANMVFNQYSRLQRLLNLAFTQFMYQYEKNYDFGSSYKDDERDTYEVAFDKGIIIKELNESVRDLKCELLGKLRSIVGTVTRVSQVRPQLVQAVFTCAYCSRVSDKIIQQFKYTTPKKCMSDNCSNNAIWQLNNKQSLFADFQKVRVQQDSSKIPPGSMPRSIDVILRNQNIQKGQPGDQIHVVGYLSVIPDIQSLLKPGQRTSMSSVNQHTRGQKIQQGINGMKGIKQLNYKLCFIGINVFVMNNQFNQQILTQQESDQYQQSLITEYTSEQILQKLFSKFTPSQRQQIKRIKQHPKVYQNLSESLFHEIFGHEEIKKSVLLQLLGGVHKKTGTKIGLRGDINLLIVGDPSTAKSQFLKCVNKFVPRSVYTNGKTTTAAGLTASVSKDQQTGNVTIQAGALLLADNGICCIDQFDKMQLKDQVAIHEAMEQQTISIAKAGIQATLHARTSILAAANPIAGRYDKTQSLKKNINISPPIMSRFDLYFIICDDVDESSDRNLSQFIVSMHHKGKQTKIQKPYTLKQVKNYISFAKKLKPRLTRQAAQEMRKFYVSIRKRKGDKNLQNSQYQVTVRQLQSMIRLSEALAKLNLNMEITSQYVKQAYRLLSCSIVKLEKATIELIDQPSISKDQKKSLGLFSSMEQGQQKKQKTKFSLDHDTYSHIRRNVLELFKQKQFRHKRGIQEVQLYTTQQDVVAFLMAQDYQAGQLSSESQNQKKTKLYHAIINHLIKQKTLIQLSSSKNPHQRKLDLHPNLQEV